ncbi:MAG: AmmeMemoRadiSam system protein B [Treponema sp.]|jgi:AmmeMemoRadiSam system protein B|nr:AmmeMemoRadiSam system protein B [Treponema sp.]
MIVREPILPRGWYPRSKGEIQDFLVSSQNTAPKTACAAIAPHAGWYYSGKIAARSVSSLKNAATVVVIGGHLPSGAPVLFAEEEGVRTPLGVMAIDCELRDLLKAKLDNSPDKYQDNTVEVLLPMVHYFFPDSKLLWLRFPGELSSFDAGVVIAETAKTLGRSIAVLGSTDLTHYGSNYGFSPKGSGAAALAWVKNTNDAAFISAVLEGASDEVLLRADKDRSSCSVGAVLGALGFAQHSGGKSKLLEYGTSADITGEEEPDSFVGYASVVWE